MALSETGEVFVWGTDQQGCLGLGTGLGRGGVEPRPRVLRELQLYRIVQISAGATHSGCLAADGKAFLWGDTDFVPGSSRLRDGTVPKPRAVR